MATALATLARNFVARHADGDGQPDLLPHVAPQGHGDLRRGARDPPQAAHVEEGLVDRQALDQRAGVLEHLEHRLAGLAVGREPGLDREQPRAEPAGLRDPHGGADAEGLRLVAGRQHDAAADRDRPAPQPRVVALLDRGEEGVEVGVQDRRADGPAGHPTHARIVQVFDRAAQVATWRGRRRERRGHPTMPGARRLEGRTEGRSEAWPNDSGARRTILPGPSSSARSSTSCTPKRPAVSSSWPRRWWRSSWANSPFKDSYTELWHTDAGDRRSGTTRSTSTCRSGSTTG